jgi:hypothetical protein
VHLVLIPDSPQTDTRIDRRTAESPPLRVWRLSRGSHIALARRTNSDLAAALPVLGGTLDLDPDDGVGTLHIEVGGPAGGCLEAVIFTDGADSRGFPVWTVSGTFSLDGTTSPVVLELRDHGVVHRAGTWRWLSGTGTTARSGRRRRHEVDSSIVVDLLFTACDET